jgi:hypothetical protein
MTIEHSSPPTSARQSVDGLDTLPSYGSSTNLRATVSFASSATGGVKERAAALVVASPQTPTPSSNDPPLPCSDAELRVLEMLLKSHRYHELRAIIQCRLQHYLACDEKRLLDESRMVDERLEEAIEHRDAMNRLRLKSTDREALVQFVVAFPNICYFPVLNGEAKSKECPTILRTIQHNGGDLRSIVSSRDRLDALCKALRDGEHWEARQAYSQADTPSEALLAVCFTELCRSFIRLACCKWNEGEEAGSGEGTPERGVSNKSVAEGSGRQASTAAGSFSGDGDAWEAVLHSNLTLLRRTEKGRKHIEGLLVLMRIARSTLALKVSVDIQAQISLLMADLLSFFDRILPKNVAAPVLDRKKGLKVCELSGIRLDDEPPGRCSVFSSIKRGTPTPTPSTAPDSTEVQSYYFTPAMLLWRRAVSDTFPPVPVQASH